VFIQTFSLLSPILFSFMLILLISLAVNPVISQMRVLKGGRKGATGLIAAVFETIPYLGPILSAVPALLFA